MWVSPACSLLRLIVVLAFFASAVLVQAKSEATSESKKEDRYAPNWQDDWRSSRHKCEELKRPLFTNGKGKLVSRELGDMPRLLAKSMLADKPATSSKLGKTKPKKPEPKGKLSKKERMKQELMGQLSPGFDKMSESLTKDEDEKELKLYEQQAGQMLMQMMNRAKLGPKDKMTLSEFCDMVWRGGNWSPLDEDEPTKDPDDIRDEEEDVDSLATKIELRSDSLGVPQEAPVFRHVLGLGGGISLNMRRSPAATTRLSESGTFSPILAIEAAAV
eukprot:CAMPEP_0115439432 /NCGR_PEP_ID=MMETSP0271-20121206/35774_1 /TAXON_ID=71861 /ORGANISM="Scrippsiella trochoidea, Strain CCMP3099" /LENGTH=273 /DNA_ID=CAMNT_0002865125 /DNA_START=54 /DNA_END=876 /DNA_ORIENTATION=+